MLDLDLKSWFQQTYHPHVPERAKNHVQINENSVVKKGEDLSGEIWWYQHVPPEIQSYFPTLLSVDSSTQYEIELVNGKNLTYLYLAQKMTVQHLDQLLSVVEQIHQVEIIPEFSQYPNELDICANYLTKLCERYDEHQYSCFPHSSITFQRLFEYFDNYQRKKSFTVTVIHGDPVFTNVIVTPELEFKLLDMRGKLGNQLTIVGDKWYDYGKIYQSLIGYDEILLANPVEEEYRNHMIKHFENYIIRRWGRERLMHIRWITASLLFSLIPLHDNEKCHQYYGLIEQLITN